ncbi:gfo/Idh/MocA family oxidoreductase [Campylobacter felis]|uniref:Gfo/Idh/MocA family oxidoreductase n=1 Tax=Campylobacter felis TaxID=2974565 RepID=A0ABT7I5H2_9BACT|nr:Gfo/Idh/MocA family oxidoreductase [Campylobacter upsaliensis]MDL0147271.1 gfo/Idh/MocA family oxidoreductase [Campylobacter felis]
MMKLKNKKALIIGFGSIGKKHFLALKTLGFEVSVVSKSASESLFEKFGVFEIYRSLKKPHLDEFELFIIANITTKHLKTLQFLDKTLKNKSILVEKPLFEKSYPFKESGRNHIFIAYLLRFHLVILTLKELLRGDKPYFASLECDSYLPKWRAVDYRQNYSAKKKLGGGVLLDLSHELDLALFLFGTLKLKFAQVQKISELEIKSDDFAFLALEKKGLKVHIRLNYFSKFEKRQIIIHTRTQSLSVDLREAKISIFKENESEILNYESDTISLLAKLQEAVLKKDKNLCTLKEAKKLLKICDKVRK